MYYSESLFDSNEFELALASALVARSWILSGAPIGFHRLLGRGPISSYQYQMAAQTFIPLAATHTYSLTHALTTGNLGGGLMESILKCNSSVYFTESFIEI